MRRAHRAVPLALALALGLTAGACRKSRDGGRCSERVAAMRAAFEAVPNDELGPRLGPVELWVAPKDSSFVSEAAEPDLVLGLADGQLFIDGEALGGFADPDSRRETLGRLDARFGRGEVIEGVALAVDRGVPWAELVALVDGLHEYRLKLWVLVFGPGDPALRESAFARRLEALEPEQAMKLAMATTREQIGACEQAEEVVARLSEPPFGAASPETVLAELPGAVEACGCKSDVEGLTETVRVLLAPSQATQAVPLYTPALGEAAGPKTELRPISAEADATWAALAEAVVEAGPKAALAVEGGGVDEPEPEPPPAAEPRPEPAPEKVH